MDPQELIGHLARLAALDLAPEARARLATDLPDILAYVARLSEVDTAGMATEDAAAEPCRLRADVASPSLPREAFLPDPPRSGEGFVTVAAWRDLEAG